MNLEPSASDPLDGADPGCRRLLLVRHGESTWNAAGLVQGHRDPGLSASGREQAARCVASILEGSRPEAVYSSDLRRARETASPIGRALGLDVFYEPALRERSLGDAEGRPSAALDPGRSGIAGGRVVDADAAPTDGESIRRLYERATRCAARVVGAHRGDIVLVCHGGTVRVLLAWLDGVSPEEMAWPEIENGVPITRHLTADLIYA